MPTDEYKNRVSQMTFHDLRTKDEKQLSPLQFGCLLGLGLKFCRQEDRPKEQVLVATMDRLRRDIRLKYKFAGIIRDKEYIKKLHVKSDWQPEHANETVENIINEFESEIQKERALQRARPQATNLSTHQFNILKHLRSNKQIIVLICDKNLGPAVMSRETYIKETLCQHLQDKKGTYRFIDEKEVINRMRAIKLRMGKIVASNLPPVEAAYFTASLLRSDDSFRDPLFYGMPKVHKNKIPVPL